MSWAHGEHNNRLCDELYENGRYPDWVLTTAFYAALHYVEHLLFKGPVPLTPYRSIRAAQDHYRAVKHEARQYLLDDHQPEIADKYRYLHQMSHNARYIDYQVSGDAVRLCRLYLNDIREFCM